MLAQEVRYEDAYERGRFSSTGAALQSEFSVGRLPSVEVSSPSSPFSVIKRAPSGKRGPLEGVVDDGL
jgi:hypothetical protein